jgi:outer membrane protein assembly factor BamB
MTATRRQGWSIKPPLILDRLRTTVKLKETSMTKPPRRILYCLGMFGVLALTAEVRAADWPMWRHDMHRSAASPQELPDRLHLQWVREFPPLKPAWSDQPKMQLDAVYEPVVMGKLLFVGSSRWDCVLALDTRSGEEKWRYDAGGPIRYAPVAWEDKVYFAADDGYLYCVRAEQGTLLWKFRGGPSERKVLGNERLVSTWPARGAPVIADGTVYFAAGIWPFMGIFVYALDARTGQVIWVNDGDGSLFMKQPHNADSFAGVAPQGPLVVAGDKLLIPGGRSVPACYDRRTGKLIHYLLAEHGKRGGGAAVTAQGKYFFNGRGAFDLQTGKYLGVAGEDVILSEDMLYACDEGECEAFDLKAAEVKHSEMIDRKGEKVKVAKWTIDRKGSVEIDKAGAWMKAGSRLYAGAPNRLVAIDLPMDLDERDIAWETEIDGTAVSLLAADDRLFAVTREGKLYCFGAERREPRTYELGAAAAAPADAWKDRARGILEATKVTEGYCIAWGVGSGRLISELLQQSQLRIIAVDSDPSRVRAARERFIADGLYGERVEVHLGDPLAFSFPPYLASLMVSEDLAAAGIEMGEPFVRKAFTSLRPYGGVACLPIAADRHALFAELVKKAQLERAVVRGSGAHALLTREGALPGAANWTHEHADAANTRVSADQRVRAPLGVLWFGGPSHDGVLPRHGHGPQPQVIDGRIIIEGVDMLRAMDIYSGRILWETRLPGVGAFYNNLMHQPGANASGTNFISLGDGIYVIHGASCLRLDPATGKPMAEFKLPVLPGDKESTRWGYLNVAGEYLIGGAEPLYDPNINKSNLLQSIGDAIKLPSGDDKTKPPASKTKVDNDNLSSSKHLVVMDRHTGKVIWTATAQSGYRHNAVCVGGGRLYAIDRLSGAQVNRMKRRGETPEVKSRLLAFDLATGKQLWSTEEDVFGTWLSYSVPHGVLVESGRNASDTLSDEPKGMRAYAGSDGKVLWFDKNYVGPAMIHGETILKGTSACELLTGKPRMRTDPLTGLPIEWNWCRTYGCNTPAASQHLLTFRSGAAGYYDLANDGGTGNFGGFRSSCTNNLIVAGGVLTAPDYTRTCICNYQNQTSLALIHMPEVETWTYFGTWALKGPVRRVGINLGAPGDRRDENGTLWLEYPGIGGKSPVVPVRITPVPPPLVPEEMVGLQWFRTHESRVQGNGPKWVAASGVKGLTSLAVTLDEDASAERTYTVRLHFVEPEDLKPGDRVFDIRLQGQEVKKDFDIIREAGGPQRALVKEFAGIKVTKDLTVSFTTSFPASAPAQAGMRSGPPVLCGIEIVAEGW